MKNFDQMIDSRIKALFPDLEVTHEIVETYANMNHVKFTLTRNGKTVKTGKCLIPVGTKIFNHENALYTMLIDSIHGELDLDDYMAKKYMKNRDVAIKMHYFSIVALRDLEKLGLTEDPEKFQELKNIVGA